MSDHCPDCRVSRSYMEGWKHSEYVSPSGPCHEWTMDYTEGGFIFRLSVRVALGEGFRDSGGRPLCIWKIEPAIGGGYVDGAGRDVAWCVREMVNDYGGKPSSIERYARNLKKLHGRKSA